MEFLVAEYNNQYEQFRHQDGLRTNYLQIYFSLATVLLAGTGLALSTSFGENLPLLGLVAFGYLFLFVVGQLSARMMVSLRVVQLETAVLIDIIRSYLADRLDVRPALLYAGALRSHPFYEPEASSTWVYRFIGVLNGVFLTCAIGFGGAAAWAPRWTSIQPEVLVALMVALVAMLFAIVTTVVRRNERRLRTALLRLRDRLDLDARYEALETGTGSEPGDP